MPCAAHRSACGGPAWLHSPLFHRAIETPESASVQLMNCTCIPDSEVEAAISVRALQGLPQVQCSLSEFAAAIFVRGLQGLRQVRCSIEAAIRARGSTRGLIAAPGARRFVRERGHRVVQALVTATAGTRGALPALAPMVAPALADGLNDSWPHVRDYVQSPLPPSSAAGSCRTGQVQAALLRNIRIRFRFRFTLPVQSISFSAGTQHCPRSRLADL